jgi:phosphoribosylamine--glycine ligase
MGELSVLLVGSGGREHALAWSLVQSPRVSQVFVAPGNAGTASLASNVSIAAGDIDSLFAFASENQVGLTVVGPELPLAAGIVDQFQVAGLPIFGPSRAAARLESSKAFAKEFMRAHHIPTAAYRVFTEYPAAQAHLAQQVGAVVVKASGLAAGKGVIVCDDSAAAESALRRIMIDQEFGAAGDEVIIESRLSGPEVSLLAFSDGQVVAPMLPARDHKRAYDHDRGPNTGGMGAYAPPPDVDPALVEQIMEQVMQPVVAGLAQQGTPYVGVLYAGLMLTSDGPQVLEFNCRFGDPETQVILPLLDGDLAEIMLACIEGRLQPSMVGRRPGTCVTVVMAAPGYPGQYPRGLPIQGVAVADELDGVMVFHAGTSRSQDQLVSSGGRVLAVSGVAKELETAANRAYQGVAQISFEAAHFRRDIGRDRISQAVHK